MFARGLQPWHCLRQGGQHGAGAIILLGLLTLGLIASIYIFGTEVPPGQMGVRQIKFGPGQGYSDRALSPGYYWSLPEYSVVHLMPTTVRILNFQGTERASAGGPVEIQTADGGTVRLDVAVHVRLYSSAGTNTEDAAEFKHGGPAELIAQVGLVENAWLQRVRSSTDDELKRALSKLSAADFYNPDKREPLFNEAASRIARSLAPLGIKVENILLRRSVFGSKKIDDAIFEKNLQEVEERLQTTESKLAGVKAELQDIDSQLDQEIETQRVTGETKANVIRSEGALYEARKQAEGDLKVAQAQAEVEKLKAQALAASSSARTMIARELVPLLQSLKGGVVSGIDPYDIKAWEKRLGVGGE